MKKKSVLFVFLFYISQIYSQDVNVDWVVSSGSISYDDSGFSVANDDSGNTYVAGAFRGSTTFGSTTIYSDGSNDVFLAKYDSEGNSIWAVRAGGISNDVAYGVSVEGFAVYVSGAFGGTINFNTPSSTGLNEIISAGSSDIFVAKFDLDGNFIWARRAGGADGDAAEAVKASSNGVYICGYFSETVNFNNPSAFGLNELIMAPGCCGTYDAFLAKYDLDGNFIWARRAGAFGNDYAKSMSLSENSIYIVGYFDDEMNFNTPYSAGTNEIFQDPSNGINLKDTYVAKYDDDGSFQWAKRAGGAQDCRGSGIAFSQGFVYVLGTFAQTINFNTPSSFGTNELTGGSHFLASYDEFGQFIWAKSYTGVGGYYNHRLLNSGDGLILSGSFQDSLVFNDLKIYSDGGFDLFMTKSDYSGDFLWAKRGGGTEHDHSWGLSSFENALYITGSFKNTANFNTPTESGSNELVSQGQSDIFLVKFFECVGNIILVNQSGNTLTADVTDVTAYQWIDCDNNNAAISGETYQSFTPSVSGNYAVIVTQNGCTDTSACQSITVVNTEDFSLDMTRIYPNPNTGSFTVAFGKQLNNATINVTDVLGKTVYTTTVSGDKHNVQLTQAEGLYFVNIQTQQGEGVTLKLVVE